MLRKILLASAALVSFAGAASAADMPARMPMKAVPYLAVYNWTGFYVGANIGYGWGRDTAGGSSTSLNGVIGGGQIGYNWQMNNLVLGLETDFQGSGQRADATGGGATLTERVRYFGTVRGRLGYAWDRTLVYVTGGYAYTNVGADLTFGGLTASSNTTKSGYTVGGGVEYAFAGPWSVKAEYLYVDSGTTTLTVGGISGDVHVKNNIGRIGINYRF
ncbi:MAG TPA: outer membrane protein [Pseudolabrys sp.]